MKRVTNDSVTWSGYCIEIANALAAKMNFTYVDNNSTFNPQMQSKWKSCHFLDSLGNMFEWPLM